MKKIWKNFKKYLKFKLTSFKLTEKIIKTI